MTLNECFLGPKMKQTMKNFLKKIPTKLSDGCGNQRVTWEVRDGYSNPVLLIMPLLVSRVIKWWRNA